MPCRKSSLKRSIDRITDLTIQFRLECQPLQSSTNLFRTGVGVEAGVKGRGWSGDVAVFDYNGDGRLDLLVVDMHSDMWMGYDDEGLIEQPSKTLHFGLG